MVLHVIFSLSLCNKKIVSNLPKFNFDDVTFAFTFGRSEHSLRVLLELKGSFTHWSEAKVKATSLPDAFTEN